MLQVKQWQPVLISSLGIETVTTRFHQVEAVRRIVVFDGQVVGSFALPDALSVRTLPPDRRRVVVEVTLVLQEMLLEGFKFGLPGAM